MRLLTILSLVLLSVHSYSQEVIPEVETVTRGGLYEEFYEKGQLRFRLNYIDGKQDGLIEFFDEDGNLWKTNTYRNGKLAEDN
jgi:antitoxin component YwqK of YwqJK toxin-antitoxin module